MVLAAGLTSRREPASNSRRLIELASDGAYDLVVTDTLLQEAYQVLVSDRFVGNMDEDEASASLSAIAGLAEIHLHDLEASPPRRTMDPDDDYLAEAALVTSAFLVSRDDSAGFEDVPGLRVGRPGTARRLLGDYEWATGHQLRGWPAPQRAVSAPSPYRDGPRSSDGLV